MKHSELPEWIKIMDFNKRNYLNTLKVIRSRNLNTVCIEANCPNRYECFSRNTATFMILGVVCTRNCLYCNIKKGIPNKVDKQEPERIAKAVKKLNLDYAVITCVTRDDLEDGGAAQFVETVGEIRKASPKCRIELLISDLGGNWDALEEIAESKPDVINHNIEIVKNIFPEMRPKGSYSRSIELLRKAKELNPKIKTKSGLIVGLGETTEQIIRTMKDLREAGCDILTVGQYLQPSPKHAEVKKYYKPEEFEELKNIGLSLGFGKMVSGPLVRSSYNARSAMLFARGDAVSHPPKTYLEKLPKGKDAKIQCGAVPVKDERENI